MTPNFRVYDSGRNRHADFFAESLDDALRAAPFPANPDHRSVLWVGEIVRRDDGTIDEEDTRDAYRHRLPFTLREVFRVEIVMQDGGRLIISEHDAANAGWFDAWCRAAFSAALSFQQNAGSSGFLGVRWAVTRIIIDDETSKPHHDTRYNTTLATFGADCRDEVYFVRFNEDPSQLESSGGRWQYKWIAAFGYQAAVSHAARLREAGHTCTIHDLFTRPFDYSVFSNHNTSS